MSRRSTFLLSALVVGYAFLYIPIALVIGFSFNESRSVAVWSGFSTKWYAALWENDALLGAVGLSLRIATVAATVAVVIGTAAAFALDRFRRLPAKPAFALLLATPLILPETITGFSLLLLFVWLEEAVGWPGGRGATTITLAHVTLGIAFATVVILARLRQLDRTLEAAAADLGATGWVTFRTVTLPLLAPAMLAAWLLAFTLSLDDLVIASFVSGPGSSTLPMVVFSSVRLGVSPQVNALATLLVVAVTVVLGLAAWLLARHERRRRQAA
ncbi:MAG: ABC transporter permease subunit [Alphaproteobacteria bacterium]|nr:ABC transporter permease subunit [Alphaproteobacteria bacterium]